MSSLSRLFRFAVLPLGLFAALHAEVRLPAVFSDNMVLQRDRAVAVWGEAAAGESVTVEFADQSKTTVAGTDGAWRVALDPLPACSDPRTLTVRGTNALTLSDVLVGEVWFCSGQSNMEKPFGPRKGQKPTEISDAEFAAASHPTLRLFHVPHSGKARPGDLSLAWQLCTPETLLTSQFSSLAYFYGRELTRELGVPVGLIHASFGGTRIEAWMPLAAFTENPALRGLEKVEYEHWVGGVQATELYRSMMAPLLPYTLRGFLWYQGEANCINAEHDSYAVKQRAQIESWRHAWQNPDAPFYYVQLAPFVYSHIKSWTKQLTPSALPALWEAQQAALRLPHTGIVPTTDLAGNGHDIHPTNKRDVGLRLARLALADTYDRPQPGAHAPRFATMQRRWFSRKLTLSFTPAESLRTRDGHPPTHFEIAGANRIFHPATAEIRGPEIVLSSPEVSRPIAARFAWHELAMPNLVNAAGLPALPFRTDDWPLTLETPKPAKALESPARPPQASREP